MSEIPSSTEVVVVGGGVMGLSAAWRLAERGRDVVLFERSLFGHNAGSSHGAQRIFRYAYADPKYVHMAQQARALWSELGDDLIAFTGGIDVGPPEQLDAIAAALETCGASCERIDAAERRARYPWLGRDDGPGIVSPDTGVIAAAGAMRRLQQRAQHAGAQLIDDYGIAAIIPEADGLTIKHSGGTIRARHAIVAAGAWNKALLGPLDIELSVVVTRQDVFFFDDTLPLVTIDWGTQRHGIPWYAVPPSLDAPWTKMGFHGGGMPVEDPDRVHPGPDPRARDGISEVVRDELSFADPEPIATEQCLYTSTPDEDFVIDARGPIVVASPCSGHGFKFAPLVGEALAALALGEDPPFDLAPFVLGRFPG